MGFSQWQPLAFTALSGGDCDEVEIASEIFISEIFDNNVGSFGAVELYNPTNSPISLSNYSIRRTTNYGDNNWTPEWSQITAAMVGRIIPANSTFLIYVGTGNFICSRPPDISNTNSFTGINQNDQIQILKGGTVIDEVRTPNYIGFSLIRRPDAEVPKAVFNNADWTTTGQSCTGLGNHTINNAPVPEIDNISRYRDNPGTLPYTYCVTPTRVRVQMDTTGGGFTYSYNLQGTTTPVNITNTTGIFSNLQEDTYTLTVTIRRNNVLFCTHVVSFNITGGTETSPIILLNP